MFIEKHMKKHILILSGGFASPEGLGRARLETFSLPVEVWTWTFLQIYHILVLKITCWDDVLLILHSFCRGSISEDI